MKTIICFLIRCYQIFIAPFLRVLSGSWTTGMCRFTPSCSNYFMEAVRRHGAWRGSLLGMRRVLRCHPWGGQGEDPVPDLPKRKLDTRKNIIL